MITGLLADFEQNKKLLPAAIVRTLEALEGKNLAELEPGCYELEGDKLFYQVQDATLRRRNECQAEAHRSYADIQIPVSGRERYGVALPEADLQATEECYDSKDVAFFPDPANEFFMDLDPGAFAVFFPGELHRPCVAIDEPVTVRKIVVKIHVSLLGL